MAKASPVATAPGHGQRRLSLVLLLSLALFWGSNFPAMKVVLADVQPWTFRMICLGFAAPVLLAATALAGQRVLIPRSDLPPLLLVAFFNTVLWHLGTAFGLQLMGAGRASIIAYTMPVWAAVFAAFVLKQRLGPRGIAALACGIAALAALILPDLGRIGAAPVGAGFVLMAAIGWAAGSVTIKAVRWRITVMQLTAWQIVLGAIPVAVGALLIEGWPPRLGDLSIEAALVFAYILLIPMTFCQWAYFKVLDIAPVSVATIGSLAIPVVGVVMSAAFLGERLGFLEIGALLLVVAAMALVLTPGRPDKG